MSSQHVPHPLPVVTSSALASVIAETSRATPSTATPSAETPSINAILTEEIVHGSAYKSIKRLIRDVLVLIGLLLKELYCGSH